MRLFTTAAALLLAAGSLSAQDTATYALDAVEKFEVGDVYTEVHEESNESNVTVSFNGQVMQKQEESSKSKYTSVTKVLAVDDQGRETNVHIYFKSFSVTAGGFDDDTLTGKVIEVTTLPDGRSKWRHYAGPGNIAAAAQKWLNAQMSEARNAVEEKKAEKAFKPKQPVKVGESWKPDMSTLMAGIGMPVDESKATGTCTLDKIEVRDGVELAHVRMKASLPVAGFPGMEGMAVQWTKGGAMDFTHTGTMPTRARRAPGNQESTYTLDGEANMQGAEVSLKIKGSEKTTTTLAGTIPELERIPEAEAKKGGAPEKKAEGEKKDEGDGFEDD